MPLSQSSSQQKQYCRHGELSIHNTLYQFVNDELLPGTGIAVARFWDALDVIVHDLAPQNRALLGVRERMQAQIDQWHQQRKGRSHDAASYQQFLREIEYLVPDCGNFDITPTAVDDEIARQAGPQLVVPVMNARFALNACNARWGSLYDALYGTDVIANKPPSNAAYDPERGAKVVAYGRDFLDRHFPLQEGSFHQVQALQVAAGRLQVELQSGGRTDLVDGAQFCGYQGSPDAPVCILLRNNGLHLELQIDRQSAIGATDLAGVKDIILESALTTIMDCEDSVSAVDVDDKVVVYRNWLGLMKGNLKATVNHNGQSFVRTMHGDREYLSPAATIDSCTNETSCKRDCVFTLPGRSLMFVRNVGLLMTSHGVIDRDGNETPEGMLDAIVTTVAAIHDLLGSGPFKNSRQGSIYIVKPKMHGPAEVAFTDQLFTRIERAFGLPEYTVKLGVMDEERRTTVNLKECIRAAQRRVVFINTGFLDRTGDEIHTSMEAGPFAPKASLKVLPWIQAYELSNVATGLACGLGGRAQIGKGMWPKPDNMKEMMSVKVAQPLAGANTAWVPSPTAATLHAMHYHQVCVPAVQNTLQNAAAMDLDALLQIPLLGEQTLSLDAIQCELDNNAQSILGYVVRWIGQGIGCSKVADITGTSLMEDRATLRISSQHMANWLHHGLCTRNQIVDTFERMALVVDKQNAYDDRYQPMANRFDTHLAFLAAVALVLEGRQQSNGYTEPLLHSYRRQAKSRGD